MISSSPAFLKCHDCKKSPKQFTFLICNHIICEKCISKNIQFGDTYNSVMCSCGSLTYFNEDSEVVEEETLQSDTNSNNQKRQFLNKGGFSNGERKPTIDQRNSFSKNLSKQTIDQYSKTLINERSTMPMLQVSDVFSLQKHDSSEQLKRQNRRSSPKKQRYLQGSVLTTDKRDYLTGTDKTRYDQSLLLENYQAHEFIERKQPVRMINEFSSLQVGKSGVTDKPKGRDGRHNSPKSMLNDVKTIKDSLIVDTTQNDKNRVNGLVTNVKQNLFAQSKPTSPSITSHCCKTPRHSQFQSELSFLKIMFLKDAEQIQYQFRKVVEKITMAYNQLEEQLRTLYVEQVVTKESLISLNLSDLVKSNYDQAIGAKFRWLKDRLFMPFYQQLKPYQNTNIHKGTKHKLNPQRVSSPLLQQPNLSNSLNHQSHISNSNNEQDLQDSAEETATMNHRRKVPQFETIEEKLERLTAKPHKAHGNRMDLVRVYHDESKKRIQTENVHTSIKRNHSHQVANQYNDPVHHPVKPKPHNITTHFISSNQTNLASPQHRLTQKPTHKPHHTPQTAHHQTVYYSPPIPYCYKHLQKRQKEARDYISYIEKLCHEKKMKNSHELFKKAKTGHQFAATRVRD